MLVSGFSWPSMTPVWSATNTSEKAIGVGFEPHSSNIDTRQDEFGVRILSPSRSAGVVDGALVVGDLAEAVLPDGERAVALLLGRGHQHVLEESLVDARQVVAVGDQEGQVEDGVLVGDLGHDRGGQGDVDRAELDLLEHVLVGAELRAVEHLHHGRVAQLLVGAARELARGLLLERAGRGGDAEDDLLLRERGRAPRQGQRGRPGGGEPDGHGGPPWMCVRARPPSCAACRRWAQAGTAAPSAIREGSARTRSGSGSRRGALAASLRPRPDCGEGGAGVGALPCPAMS